MARILLVDDEKVARGVYGDYLTAGGHDVTAVSSLSDAKQALGKDPYDVVVADLILPDGNGLEVLLHAREAHLGVEVVLITALDKVEPAVRAMKAGAAEYLIKPVAPEVLQHAVNRTLTTRALLRENESLREHVRLVEAGQRIATTLDKDRLLTVASNVFGQVCRADAVLLYVRQSSGELHPQGTLSEEQQAWAATLDGDLKNLGNEPRRLSKVPDGFAATVAIPCVEGEASWGCAVLLYRGEPPATCESAGAYLGRHLGLALRNLGRFAEVEDLAYLDDLTHLFNNRYLELIIEREVRTSQATQGSFSLLFLDLDYFKSVNDTHGHLVGSKLLVEVARLIKACVRDDDVVVRYGGDEYVVLLRNTDSGGALKVAERIRRTMETHHFLAREGFGLSVTTCIGVASFPEHAQDKASLLDLADRAMYRGKKTTRNVIYVAARGLEATPSQRHSAPGSR